jgi:pimeloyl-ACP methyl ester carboxylesterase
VVVDNLKIHYLQAGRGRDVILLHGIGASVYVWRFIFPLLEKRFRVTAIDLPGFGKSHKDVRRDYGLDAQTALIGKTIKTMGLRDPILVGSSMGGAIALWLARSEPLRFKKVVALAPATDSRLVPSSLQHFSPFSPLFRRTLNRKTMKLMLKRIITKHSLITDEVVEAYLEPFLDRGDSVRTFWSALSLLADPRLPKDLSAVSADVLVIYGERDLLVSRRSIDRLMKTLPHARLVLHRQAGHHIMEDEPEWLSETIMTFLES